MKRKIVQLGEVRDLLAELDVVRQRVLAGDIAGWYGVLRDTDGEEVIYLGGLHKTDAAVALRSALKLSAARALAEDEPLHLCKG